MAKITPIVKKWIAALRSGNYTQGQGACKLADGSMCCLGVLQDVIDPTLWSKRTHHNPSASKHCYRWNKRKNALSVNDKLLHDTLPALTKNDGTFSLSLITDPTLLAHVKGVIPICHINKGKTALAVINDRGGDFALIADVIEHLATKETAT